MHRKLNSPLNKVGPGQPLQPVQIENTQSNFGMQSKDLNKKRALDEVSNQKPNDVQVL